MQARSVSAKSAAILAWGLGAFYAAASGVLLALALPPYDVPLLGFVAFAPLLVAIWNASRYTALPYGLLAAITAGCLLTGLPFTAQDNFDHLALVPFGVFGALLSVVLMAARRLGMSGGWATALGVGAVGVLTEWVAARVDFPYTVALTLWRNPLLLWVASWVGVWGLAFLVWAANTILAQAWAQRRLTTSLKTLVAALLVLHALGWLQMSLDGAREQVRVAVLQSERALFPALIAEAKSQGAQLIVVPEVSWDVRDAIHAAR
ncbi:MAG: hypothetical protein ACK4P5_01335, partial [Fimbriimonadales bacterium]